MTGAVRVVLSSGDQFYVAAEMLEITGRLEDGSRNFVYLGRKLVSPRQVALLEYHPSVPSVEVVESLED